MTVLPGLRVPLREALQPNTPLQQAEQAELIISQREPASRSGSSAGTGPTDAVDSGRLDEVVDPLLASGPRSPNSATVSCDFRSSAPWHARSHEPHVHRSEKQPRVQAGRDTYDTERFHARRKQAAAPRSGSWSSSPAPAAPPR